MRQDVVAVIKCHTAVTMITNDDEKYMQAALKEAKKAYYEDEVPVGCVIVWNDKIIARGHNKRDEKKSQETEKLSPDASLESQARGSSD